MRLETARLILRPVTPADRADLIALEADPLVMRYLNGGRPVPEEGITTGEYLTPRGAEPEVMAVLERATGDFIGWFGFFVEPDATVEIGYRLKRSAWGKGYGTEGAVALISDAFAKGFTCVRAETMAVNAASRRVMEKAGMRHVRTYFGQYSEPVAGAEEGDVIYEIRRP